MQSAAALPQGAFWSASARPASAFCCCSNHPSRAKQRGSSSNRQVQAASLGQAGGRGGQVLLASVLAPWARAASLGLRPKQLLRGRRFGADAATKLLLACSVMPAALLAVQPLWTCTAALDNSLAWGALRDMFSFTVLLGVFITCEPAAATASAVSAAGGALALACSPAGLPAYVIVTASLLVSAAAATLWAASAADHTTSVSQPGHPWKQEPNSLVTASQADVQVPSQQQQQQQHQQQHASLNATEAKRELLGTVQHWLGVLGGGLLLQFLWSVLTNQQPDAKSTSSWLATVAAGAAAAIGANSWLSTAGADDAQLQTLKSDWPAWSATLLLILQALQQLVQVALYPGQVLADGPSLCQLLLLVLANGLMVPRALRTRQFMWFTGTCSGALLAAGQLVVLAAHSLSRQLQPTLNSFTMRGQPALHWGGALLPSYSSHVGFVAGLACVALLLWLWVTGRVLQQGWQWIQADCRGL